MRSLGHEMAQAKLDEGAPPPMPSPPSPLTPTLSPSGRGSQTGADDEDGLDIGSFGH